MYPSVLIMKLRGKMNGGIIQPFLVTTPNTMILSRRLFFYTYRYILWEKSNLTIVLLDRHQILVEIFLTWEKANPVRFEGILSLFKSIVACLLLLSFIACDKHRLLLILYEKCHASLYTTSLIRNSDTLMILAMGLINLLTSVSILAWISGINSEVLFFLERSD